MEHVSTSRHRYSGKMIGSVHFLMLGCLIPLRTPIALSLCPPATEDTSKKRAYDPQIRDVEHGYFSPLLFSVSGGMGSSARVVYKKLASMIATKHNQSYSQTINWLSFSLLHSSITCIRGSRSTANHAVNPQLSEAAIDLAIYNSRVAFD